MQDTQSSISQNMRHAKMAFYASVSLAIVLAIGAAVQILFNSPSITSLNSAALLIALGCAMVCAFLSRTGKSYTGSFLVIGSILFWTIARVFILKGLAVPVGAAALVITTGFALYTLPRRLFGRIVMLSVAVVLVSVVIDQFSEGIPAVQSSLGIYVVSLFFTAVYVWLIGSQFNRYSLQIKFIIGLIGLAIVPLLIIGFIAYGTTQNIIEKQIKADLRETSSRNSAVLANFVQTQITIIGSEARQIDIYQYLEQPEYAVSSQQEQETLSTINAMQKKDTVFIRSYALINREGIVVLDTNSKNIDQNVSKEPYFTETIQKQIPYVSAVLAETQSNESSIYFAAPVIGSDGTNVGIILVRYNASIIQSLLQQAEAVRSTGTEFTFVVDSDTYVTLAHSNHPEVINKTYKNFSPDELLALQLKGIIAKGTSSEVVFSQPDLVAQLASMENTKEFSVPAWEVNGGLTNMSAIRVPNTSWILVAAQPESAISAIIQNQTRIILLSIIGTIVVIAFIAYFIARIFTGPILNITSAAERILQGDFGSRTTVKTQDEIGILARTFNSMSAQIQELVSSLETRVSQRTSDLESTSEQSQKRARELQAIAEIARIISTERDFSKLLTLITITVSERFNFYHVGIFLLDENKKFAVLRASNSEGGQTMLKRNHQLEVGQVGIVGFVTAAGQPRIALDTGSDAVFFNNPDLPNTRSEMALPLMVRGSVIGALDVQSVSPNAFTQDDISVLSLLADQVAIAIENAQLLEETQRALSESQSVYRDYVTNAWQKKTSGGVAGYYLSAKGGELLTSPLPSNGHNGSSGHTLAIPIRVREQLIGYLNVRSNTEEKKLTKDQINLVESIADRLGLALDNARLFEETSTRASRERAVADITTKIRSTNDPQEMIRTAIEELQQVLGARQIEIVPGKPQLKTDI